MATCSATEQATPMFCFDHQYVDVTLTPQVHQHVCNLVDDNRGQAFGRLVHHQQFGIEKQRPADRQHLLLATRQLSPAV